MSSNICALADSKNASTLKKFSHTQYKNTKREMFINKYLYRDAKRSYFDYRYNLEMGEKNNKERYIAVEYHDIDFMGRCFSLIIK